MSAGAILVVTAAGLLWHRRRGGRTSWVRHAAAGTAVGTLLGVGAGALAGREIAMPVTFGVTALGSLLVAYAWLAHLRPALVRD